MTGHATEEWHRRRADGTIDPTTIPLQIDDGAKVRTARLLASPNVRSPPTNVHAATPVPTPSEFKDGRGSIFNIESGRKRVNILYTERGVLRSGDIHPNTQHDFIFDGAVRVWTLQQDGTTKITPYARGAYITIPPYVPHVFEFTAPTVMAEWWEPDGFVAYFYEPYRKYVDASYARPPAGRAQGRGLVTLVPETAAGEGRGGGGTACSLIVFAAGVAFGTALGWAAASRGSRR